MKEILEAHSIGLSITDQKQATGVGIWFVMNKKIGQKVERNRLVVI